MTESSPERSFALSRSSAADFVLTVVVSRASRSIYARIDLWLQEVRQLAGTAVAVHRTRAPWGDAFSSQPTMPAMRQNERSIADGLST